MKKLRISPNLSAAQVKMVRTLVTILSINAAHAALNRLPKGKTGVASRSIKRSAQMKRGKKPNEKQGFIRGGPPHPRHPRAIRPSISINDRRRLVL